MTVFARVAASIFALLLTPVAQNPKKLLKMEHKFQEQKDPVHQAKELAKLLPKEIEMASKEVREGQTDAAIGRLRHYRNDVVKVHEDLLATGRNPVKQSDGFRQLQISLRESLRRLHDLILDAPLESQAQIEKIRQDLAQVNSQLLQELFPPPPRRKPKKKKH